MVQVWFLIPLAFLAACTTVDRSAITLKREIRDVDQRPVNPTGQPRKRVMVLPFLDANPTRGADLKAVAHRALITDLNKSGEVIAIDSRELAVDLSRSLKSGQYDMTQILEAAKKLGVNAILEGKVQDIRIKRSADNVGLVRQLSTVFEVVGQVRVVTVRNGKEVFNTIKTVTVEEKGVRVAERVETDKYLAANPRLVEVIVKDAFLDFTPQVLGSLDKVTWEGRIAAINGDRIYLNVGRVSGLQVGDLLRVSEEGGDVYDPEGGGHIGRVPGRQKGTLEIISYFGQDGSIAVVHSGSGFRENDRVELY